MKSRILKNGCENMLKNLTSQNRPRGLSSTFYKFYEIIILKFK